MKGRAPGVILCVLSLAVAVVAGGCAGRARTAAAKRATHAGFPVALADAQKVSVTVPRRPARIVSTAPTVTEILFAIGAGDRVVAVSDQCNYPAEAKKLPHVGGFFTPSAEKVLAARPDLVLAQRGNPPEFIAALRRARIPVFTIAPKTLEDILTDINDLGRVTGAGDGAARVVEGMRARMKAIADRLSDIPVGKRPTAFIFIAVGPVWTAGKGTFQDDAIRAAGARNAGATVTGFKEFSSESLVAADPDYLLVSTMTGDPEFMKKQILASSALKRLTAAREGRIVVLDSDEVMRPGPRIVEAIEQMARAFHPERFRE
jgi:iron complex transport system substrate-binding protein